MTSEELERKCRQVVNLALESTPAEGHFRASTIVHLILAVVREAMKEPSDAMVEAADKPFHDAWRESREQSVRPGQKETHASSTFSGPLWRAMFAASPLGETQR